MDFRPSPLTSPLSLHDALPISSQTIPASHRRSRGGGEIGEQFSRAAICFGGHSHPARENCSPISPPPREDRKSTRLNSSHEWISYAVFCLKKNTMTRSSSST